MPMNRPFETPYGELKFTGTKASGSPFAGFGMLDAGMVALATADPPGWPLPSRPLIATVIGCVGAAAPVYTSSLRSRRVRLPPAATVKLCASWKLVVPPTGPRDAWVLDNC